MGGSPDISLGYISKAQGSGINHHVNAEKCHLGPTEVTYLGFSVGRGCLWAHPDKAQVLSRTTQTHNKKDLQHFGELSSYYW